MDILEKEKLFRKFSLYPTGRDPAAQQQSHWPKTY